MQRLTLSKLQPQLGIAVLALSAGLLLAGLLGRNLYVEREAAIDAARDRMQELAQLLEEHARQHLQRVELTLLMAVDAVDDHRESGSTDLPGLQHHLRALLPKDSMLRALAVIDPNGRTLLSTQSLGTKGMPDMSGRDFFTAQRGQAGLGMFAGTPALVGQAGLWTLPVSMRLATDDGTFQGVLLAEVDPGVIGRYYASIDTGANGFVTLFQRSGWIVARAPHSEAILSRNWAESPMFRQHLPNAANGTVRQIVAATGIDSLYSYRALKDYPFVVSVGLSLTDGLAAWRTRAWRDSVLMLLILSAMGAATLALLRQQRRREAAEKDGLRLSAIVNTTSDFVATARVDGQMTYMNAAARRTAGIGADEDISTRSIQQFYGPERWATMMQVARPAALRDGAWSGVTQLSASDGRQIAASQVLIPHRDESGEPEFFTTIARDISQIEQGRMLAEGQKQVLEMVADGAPLADTLTALLLMLQSQLPGTLASVLLLDADGVHLRHGAAPSLPPAYAQAIDGVAIGEGVGFCGTAAFRREAVLVEDIATDPLWKDLSELALSHGLRACWSTPIVAAHGRLLGTFAIYRRAPGLPGARERRLIDMATQSAAIAISRHQLDRALQESEARFRSLTELSSDWYWEQDQNFRFVHFSDSVAQQGSTPASHYGKTRWELPFVGVTEQQWAEHRALLQARQPFREFDYQRIAEQGQTIWLSVSGDPVFDADGNFTGYRGIGRNITERKRTEQAMRANEERLRTIIDTEPECVKVVSADGLLMEMNPSGLAMIEADTMGQVRGVQVAGLIAPKDRDAFNALHHRVMQGENATLEFEVIGLRGSRRWMETHATPMRSLDGRIVSHLAVTRDISERKRAEQERQQLESQLRQAQKMDAMGTLAGGIAHDFNNILAAILGNVTLARQDTGAGHPAQLSLDEIAKAGQRARDLVQQILAFSRQQPLQHNLLDLREIADDAIKLLRASLPANVALDTRFASDCPNVLGDRTHLQQVLMNLGTNAWHALGAQGGSIEIAVEAVQVNGEHGDTPANVHIPANGIDLPAGRHVHLIVKDNGKGMDEATKTRIFDPFFTTKAPGEGTGLGLSVVDSIVKGHGGAITCYSQVGVGSSFHVYLPAQQQQGAVAAQAQSPGPGQGQGRTGKGQRILFLDDEEALVLMTTRLLERRGYEVKAYSDSEEALAAFKADPEGFDLLMTDFNMPGPNGLDVASQVLKLRPGLPVALASGYVTDELREKAAALGITEVLYKPVAVERLVEAIRRMLDPNK